jgi:type 2 lantibiotic biosynthesis protein LanM
MNEWIRDIAGRSSSLAERRTGLFQPAESEGDTDDSVRKRMEHWRHIAAKGDAVRFNSRLALAGMTASDAERLLRPARLRDDAELPDWTVALKRIALAMEEAAGDETHLETLMSDPVLVPEKPLPFEHLFLPVIAAAEKSLREHAGSLADTLTWTAWNDVKRGLLKLLTRLSWRALVLEFSVFRFGSVTSPDSRTEYFRFIKAMFRGRWSAFLREYSVLAKLIAIAAQQWEDSLLEFLQRYENDKPWRNRRIVPIPPAEGVIDRLTMDGADSHNGGRRVMVVTLASGGKLVYKPKNLALDEAYSSLITWLRDAGAPCEFMTADQIDCGNYGWQSYIAHEPIKDESEFNLFYRRAGGLLCLAHLLGATDLHEENVVACGAYPVPVDLETLLQPMPGYEQLEDPDSDAEELAVGRRNRSVTRTMLLPYWRSEHHAGNKDISGLFGEPEAPGNPVMIRGLLHPNTDAMKPGDISYKPPESPNLPYLRDQGPDFDFTAVTHALVQGYQEMYRFLLDNRDSLLAESGPLRMFKGLPARLIFRPTSTYGHLLETSLSPEFLRDGVDRDIQLDAVSRFLLSDDELFDRWPLVQRELDDLWRMDIPYFRMRTDDCRVRDGSGPYGPVLFEVSAYDRMIRVIRDMSESDCRFQSSMIRGVIYAKLYEKGLAHAIGVPAKRLVQLAEHPGEETAGDPLEAAEAIAARLNGEAVFAADGSRSWIGPKLVGHRYRQGRLGPDLYEGVCGIALFYAALAKTTGKPNYRNDALSTLQLLRERLRSGTSFAKAWIGGMEGLGSIIYTFVRVGRLLDEPELLEEAARIVSRMTDERIQADEQFDIMYGAAGAILSLLVLYEATQDPIVLKRAVQCGEHLLRHRTAQGDGFLVWAGMDGKALAGFSHGAAGIAYALIRLYAHTQDERFLEAAREAVRYETFLFRSGRGVWPDLRVAEGQAGLTDAWCNGAAGIGLSRLNMMDALPADDLRNDIDSAVRIVRSSLHNDGRDHLCCGTMGRVEFLLSAGRKLNRPDIESEARLRAARIVRKYAESPDGDRESVYHFLGFFNGMAGIGYEWLRLHHPEDLPSVLLLE